MTKSTLCAVALALVLCAAPGCKPKAPEARQPDNTDLVVAAGEIARQLERNLRAPIPPDKALLISTFVNVNNLQESSPFGRILSELVASRLAQNGYKVVELKLRQKSLFIEEKKGEFLLSRDLREISLGHNASVVVVGTYGDAFDRAYVSVRLVRTSDSVILSSCDHAVPMKDWKARKSLLVPESR